MLLSYSMTHHTVMLYTCCHVDVRDSYYYTMRALRNIHYTIHNTTSYKYTSQGKDTQGSTQKLAPRNEFEFGESAGGLMTSEYRSAYVAHVSPIKTAGFNRTIDTVGSDRRPWQVRNCQSCNCIIGCLYRYLLFFLLLLKAVSSRWLMYLKNCAIGYRVVLRVLVGSRTVVIVVVVVTFADVSF
jgi:hypothetical protein